MQTQTQTQIQEQNVARDVVEIEMQHRYKNENYVDTVLTVTGKSCVEIERHFEDPYEREECEFDHGELCYKICFTSVKEIVVKLDVEDFTNIDDIVNMCRDALAEARARSAKFIANKAKLLNALRGLNVYVTEKTA